MNQVEMKRRQIESYTDMVGLVSLLVLSRILGNEGIAYVAVAYESMIFFWCLIGSRASRVLGRMIKLRNSRGQYRNMRLVGKNIGRCQGILAFVCSVLLALGAEKIAGHLFGVPFAASAVAIMAPALFLRVLSATRLGMFQGEGREMPAVFTGVVRQILYLLLSLLFSGLLSGYGEKVSHLLGRESFHFMYGSMGVSIAIVLTELFILLFLLLLRGSAKKDGRSKMAEGMRMTDSFGQTVRAFYTNMGVEAFVCCLERFPIVLGIILCLKKMSDSGGMAGNLGIFYGKYMVFCGLVIFPVCAVMMGIYTKVVSGWKRGEQRVAKTYFQSGLHLGVIHGLFFTVLMSVLAGQLAEVFAPDNQKLLTSMLRFGSGVILFVILDYFFLQILLLTGQKLQVLGSLAAANLLMALVVVLGKDGFVSLVCGLLLGSIGACLLLGWFTLQIFGSSYDWIQILAIPAGGISFAGLAGMLLAKVLTPHLGSLVTVLVVVIVSVILYWGFLLFFRNLKEQELQLTPMGHLVYTIGHLLHLV